MPLSDLSTDTADHALPALESLQDRFFNREQSWLAFNRRVLSEARRAEYPLLERLRFLSISGNNLDEFLMVRVAGLAAQVRRHIAEASIDGLSPPEQLAAIRAEVLRLEAMQQDVWEELRPQLGQAGIAILGEGGRHRLNAGQGAWLTVALVLLALGASLMGVRRRRPVR